MPRQFYVCIVSLVLCLIPAHAQPIRLVSAEGKETMVYGVLEARPEGLVIQMREEGDLISVPWAKMNMDVLRQDHTDIHTGYLDTQEFGRPILLRLGGFDGILTYEEAITALYQGLQRDRFYTLPENVDYLFEDDPDVIRLKERDYSRYNRAMREYRRELQDFLREIFPRESIIISDAGVLHRKQRSDLAELDKGETSLAAILRYLSDTRHTVSRVGLLYLREVSTFPEDFESLTLKVGETIPNVTFRYGNANHMKLPVLLAESQSAVAHLMEAKSIHRGEQYKLGEFYNFVFGQAEEYGANYSRRNATKFNKSNFPRLDFSDDF